MQLKWMLNDFSKKLSIEAENEENLHNSAKSLSKSVPFMKNQSENGIFEP